jgi:MFS family permease
MPLIWYDNGTYFDYLIVANRSTIDYIYGTSDYYSRSAHEHLTTCSSLVLIRCHADLNGGSNFIWVGAAYTLCATAFIPLSGNLAQVGTFSSLFCLFRLQEVMCQLIGRRPLILGSLFLVAVGSAVAGSAHSMSVLIGGRGQHVLQGHSPFTYEVKVMQGLGGGGISSSTAIIISDLVNLQERGLYNSFIAA